MGSQVKAACKYGYEENFMIGGGMQNFQTFCAFPALCKKCNRIVSANLLRNPPECPKCHSTDVVAYDQSERRKRKGRHAVAAWNVEEQLGRKLELTDGRYFRPACNSFDLGFRETGFHWD